MQWNLQNTTLTMSAGFAKQIPADLQQIAFSGLSNVGKSSLINLLLGRKSLARVSSAPGKTVTINFYRVDNAVYFVDLPGYGYARRDAASQAQWSSLTDGYFRANDHSHLLRTVVQLVDAKVGITRDDAMMLDYMNQAEIPYFIVATKVDKLNATDRKRSLAEIASHEAVRQGTVVIPCSSLKKEGKDEILGQIYAACH
jgi:GTP-binding protein